ncbi:MAG: DoxX family protein [Phycisphaerales bacterium]|nr:DoxX family protein [Phycisphaerales bacterium]
MRFRDQVALTLPALVLRLVLALVFLWAGIGKFATSMPVSGDDAARLANLGVTLSPVSGTPMTPEATEDEQPLKELPQSLDVPSGNDQTDEIDPELNTPEDQQKMQDILDEAKRRAEEAKKKAAELTEPPAVLPATDPAADPTDEPTEETNEQAGAGETFRFLPAQYENPKKTASDFPEPMEVRSVYSIALLLSKCAEPGLTADSQAIPPILPSAFAGGTLARSMAIAAAVTEIGAGILLLLGFLTRFSALGTFTVMLVAIWTTQIGPAAMQTMPGAPSPILGFLPNHGSLFAYEYTTLMFQLACAAMSIAVFFLGSGPIGFDRLIFGASRRDKYLHGDPKAPASAPPKRDSFDRSPNPTP